MKTKVAKLVGLGKLDILSEEVSKPKAGEVIVEMKAVGICGSDLHYFLDGGLGSFKEKLPKELGHEPSGKIVDANSIDWLREGDRIAIDPGVPCLHCKSCKKGKHNLCQDGGFMGADGSHGAFREYAVVHESQIVKLNDQLTYVDGALLEPLGIAFHAINLINFKINNTVAIFGAGPIGLSILNLVVIGGASSIFVIDKLEYRLEIAKKYGATNCLIDSADVVQKIRDLSGGGVDIAFDAAGMQKTVDGCFEVAGRGGKISLVGIPTYDCLTYNPHKARTKELEIYNTRRSNQTLSQCHDLFPKVNVEGMVTHKYSIDDIQRAFETASSYRDNVVKAMISF